MHIRNNHPGTLKELLRPETALEKTLLVLPSFRHGLLWGEPRYGHPEGKVAWHVREVFDNIDLIPNLSLEEREQLRLIALVHDTFKYAEDRSRPRDWSRHHGRIARNFIQQYTSDALILDVVEMHDDAYYAWLNARYEKEQTAEGNTRNLEALLKRIDHCLQIYYIFFKCDTQTGDKTQAPIKWFEENVPGIERISIK